MEEEKTLEVGGDAPVEEKVEEVKEEVVNEEVKEDVVNDEEEV